MKLPDDLRSYQKEGLVLRPLTPEDVPAMLSLQAQVMAALPDSRWYFPSEEEEFRQVVSAQEAFGYFAGEELVALGEISPGDQQRADHCYAAVLGLPLPGSYDFHDIMVRPDYRRQGIHSRFLQLFEQMVRKEKGYAIFATIDPDNEPSWRSFEKAGYRLLLTQPAYDGRMRRYYRLDCLGE